MAGASKAAHPDAPVFFPAWQEALRRAPLSPPQQTGYAMTILDFLRECRRREAPPTRARANAFLARPPPQTFATDRRAALEWFFRAAREVLRAKP